MTMTMGIHRKPIGHNIQPFWIPAYAEMTEVWSSQKMPNLLPLLSRRSPVPPVDWAASA